MTSPDNHICIAIIDDNPGSLEYLSNALARNGVRILAASDPQEGLDLVYANRPGIVLSDVVMPGMSGLEVLNCIKKFDPSTDVILMSARNDDRTMAEAMRNGAAGYLEKPISLACLRKCLGDLIQSHAANGIETCSTAH
ncbi:MAG TPA: response regulator [Candidatus Angelobacter sp.]|nr:response regulator [Candidatus Angelobacter sp.]